MRESREAANTSREVASEGRERVTKAVNDLDRLRII